MMRRRTIGFAAAAAVLVTMVLPVGQGPAEAEPGHEHEVGCDENHPAVVDLRNRVAEVLSGPYRNLAQVVASGFIPYFDAVVPYGNTKPYPADIETGLPYFNSGYPDPETWVKHYIQPWWMDDGDNVNPVKPESILLDEWDRPIGVMFIADLETQGDPLYINEDGTPCSPWHKHVDEAAVYMFWGYRYFFKGNAERPSETPPMMHVWVNNSDGTFAHDYPPPSDRKGPPPPGPYQCTPSMETGPLAPICNR